MKHFNHFKICLLITFAIIFQTSNCSGYASFKTRALVSEKLSVNRIEDFHVDLTQLNPVPEDPTHDHDDIYLVHTLPYHPQTDDISAVPSMESLVFPGIAVSKT